VSSTAHPPAAQPSGPLRPALSTPSTPLGGRLLAGCALAGFLALLDVVTPWFVGPLVDDEYAPGTGGILTLVVLGLLTLLALGLHLRRRSRGWLRVVAALRTVSAVTAVPAFVVDGVAPVAVAAAAVCVALTVVCLVLLLSPRLAPR